MHKKKKKLQSKLCFKIFSNRFISVRQFIDTNKIPFPNILYLLIGESFRRFTHYTFHPPGRFARNDFSCHKLSGSDLFFNLYCFFFKVLTQDIKVLITKVADLQKDVTTLQVLQSKATDKNQLVEEKIEQLQRQLLKTEGQ